ncbi:MAG: hypothetical protein IKY87_01120 [Paludibacteraceae bacterium]|nr:hypothetical protein [Paludibacteraceae bacterium]
MNKSDFIKCLRGDVMPRKKKETPIVASVTDPSYAQSVRQSLTNPLPYDVKPIYANGVAAKDMQPFDGMYKDKHQAFQAAKELETSQQTKVKDWKESQSKTKEKGKGND